MRPEPKPVGDLHMNVLRSTVGRYAPLGVLAAIQLAVIAIAPSVAPAALTGANAAVGSTAVPGTGGVAGSTGGGAAAVPTYGAAGGGAAGPAARPPPAPTPAPPPPRPPAAPPPPP